MGAGIHEFSPEAQIALVPLIWIVVPIVYMAIAGQGLCAPAKGWWVVSLVVYAGWLALNNPIAQSYVGII